MDRPSAAVALSLISMLAGPIGSAVAVPTIDVGTIVLEPNTANQVVEIYVHGGDEVTGLDFHVMVANGGLEMEATGAIPTGTGIRGPSITAVDIVTGTIFANNNTGQVDSLAGLSFPQLGFRSTSTQSGSVVAEGLLARVTLDTTGYFEGSFDLSLTAGGIPTSFVDVAASLADGQIMIDSEDSNQPPVASAGPDQTVAAEATVCLAGSGGDPEGASVSYRWLQIDGPAVVLDDWWAATPSFAAPDGLINTDLVFELTVSDGELSATDTVTIHLEADDSLFHVDAGADQTVAAGALVQLTATLTTASARTISVEWVQVGGPTVSISSPNSINATFIAPVGVTNTDLTFEAHAYDATYETVDTVTVTVAPNSANPTAWAGYDQAVAAGATVQLSGSGTDPAGTGLSYLWVQIDGEDVQLSSETLADPTFVAPLVTTSSVLEFELRVSSGTSTSIDTVLVNVTTADDSETTDGADSAEESSAQITTLSEWLAGLSWSSVVAFAIELLIVALLLLWFFVL